MILGRDPESFRLPSKGRTVNICHSSKYASFLSKYTCILSFYSPQTKFAKVVFLHLSVSHSVHMGGGGIPACLAGLQAHTQGGS